ncbi:MAG: helix-turn-helix domain-containing protein [Sporomusaceae bacterium]|jgi:putative transposase|nr:helix-turn-helix domain-containing protein [Sporomusaceae bacterium]
MLKSVKVRLRPNRQQEARLWQAANTARFAYNWALARQKENRDKGGKFLNDKILRKEFTELKQKQEYSWLYEISNNVTKQAIKDACGAFKKFFQGLSEFPKFKNKKRTKPRFYNDNVKLKFQENRFLLEKVGWVKISEPERIGAGKFHNPRISFDGKYWYISIGIEIPKPDLILTKETVLISPDLKEWQTKKQTKKMRRLQRQTSRKYGKNKKGKEYVKTGNIIKLEKKIRLIYRQIANTRLNHLHQATAAIVKTKPKRIVLEALHKSGYLTTTGGEQGLSKFKYLLAYKCSFYGIEFIDTARFTPGHNQTAIA